MFKILLPAAILLVGYGAGVLAATVAALTKRFDRALVLMPAVLTVMHVGWGLGFLRGPPRGSD